MTRPRGSKERGEEKPLTEVELELMTILWKLGEGSVAEVILQLPKQRQLAYTSVSTILRLVDRQMPNPFRTTQWRSCRYRSRRSMFARARFALI